MKKLIIASLFLLGITGLHAQQQTIVGTDIDNFWIAYDKIVSTTDTVLQYQYLNDLYISKGSPGLVDMMSVRNYTAEDYLDAINNYPLFWPSMRENTKQYKNTYAEIEQNIFKLKAIYPSLMPSTIYFTIGAFSSNGTILNNHVLIGSELAFGDTTTVISEFPEYRQQYFKVFEPKKNLALLCTHEYVHTQQKIPLDNLLSYCIYEGIAEFVSCLATGKPSTSPAIAFGKTNTSLVANKFAADMFNGNIYDWMWGENSNELKIRDLGYFIGYEISERYYNAATDKQQAIKDLIELDYTNEDVVEHIVDQTQLLPKTLENLWADFELSRPKVLALQPFENNATNVQPGTTDIVFTFSQPVDVCCQGLDYGPLGAAAFTPIPIEHRNFSPDGKTWTIKLNLEPGKQYQYVLSTNFRDAQGNRLKPYLLDFTTAPK